MARAVPSSIRRRGSRRGSPERTDEQLVDAIRAGDHGAFDELYERHHRPLLAFCRHMLGTREEAEDALQLAFVSAHARFVEPVPVVAVRAFLYTVARNRCLSVLRARRDVVALDLVAEPATDGLALEAEVERRQDLRELLGDLAGLPEDQRAALVLAELQDLSHDEIATALDVRTDKVKALVFQAREALMARRTARTADCSVIQEQLATLRGSALRRSSLRRHIEVCGACSAFEAEVGRQRAAFALVLPVIPSLALKDGIFAALSGGGGVAAAGIGASTAGVFGGAGVVAKSAAVLALAGSAAGGGAVIATRDDPPAPRERTAPPARPTPRPASVVVPGVGTVTVVPPGSSQDRGTSDATSKSQRPSTGRPGSPGRSVAAKAAAAAAKRQRARAAGRERAAARRAARAATRSTKPLPASSSRPAAKVSKPTRAASRPPGTSSTTREASPATGGTVKPDGRRTEKMPKASFSGE